ncbi:hypothetical protein FHG87_009131 [Trinorchestia longiramus]|nr:hypothetical protein FHG87_009131 [Trinorchestia longiramus]
MLKNTALVGLRQMAKYGTGDAVQASHIIDRTAATKTTAATAAATAATAAATAATAATAAATAAIAATLMYYLQLHRLLLMLRAQPDAGHNLMQGTTLCKAQPYARHNLMQGTTLCKAQPYARHNLVQGTTLCKAQPAADMVDAARNTAWDLGKTTE